MYQLDLNVSFNEENGVNELLIGFNRWQDQYLPLRYIQFINNHYDSLEQQIKNTYEINTGVVLFATPEKIFCINLNADDILLTSIEIDEERYSKTGKPHFNLTHFHDREINDDWIYRIVSPTFNLFWRQILRSVSDTFNDQRTGLLTLIEDCPTDSDFQLISPENCLEYEDKVITEQILNSKVTQFPLFLKPQEKYRQISLALESNIKKAHHCDFFNFIADQTLCNINGLINYNKIPAKYKSEEFKIFSLALDKSFKYWRKMSDMGIFVEYSLSKQLPFIPIRCSFKNCNQEIPNSKPDKLFNECVNSILDIEDIERIAREYGCEFKKVLGINLYNTHFTTHTVYYINGYYEQVTQKIARDEFIKFKNDSLNRVAHLLKNINPLIKHFTQAHPNDENLRDFFELKKHLDLLYRLADERYSYYYQQHYDTKEIDVI
jgi:hypothetical protein